MSSSQIILDQISKNNCRKRFRETFGEDLLKYGDGLLLAFGLFSFDIIRFERTYLYHRGYKYWEKGSMKDFITETWDQKASELIEEILDIKSWKDEKVKA